MSFDKDEFGFIIGSFKSKAASMYKVGATRLEIMAALGDDHYNVLRELEKMGYKITKKKVAERDPITKKKTRLHYRYFIGNKNE